MSSNDKNLEYKLLDIKDEDLLKVGDLKGGDVGIFLDVSDKHCNCKERIKEIYSSYLNGSLIGSLVGWDIFDTPEEEKAVYLREGSGGVLLPALGHFDPNTAPGLEIIDKLVENILSPDSKIKKIIISPEAAGALKAAIYHFSHEAIGDLDEIEKREYSRGDASSEITFALDRHKKLSKHYREEVLLPRVIKAEAILGRGLRDNDLYSKINATLLWKYKATSLYSMKQDNI